MHRSIIWPLISAADPEIGERKKGDLAALWVYKFRSQNQLYLLGYSRDDGLRLIYLEAVGPHENFYRDLKRCIGVLVAAPS